MQSTETDLLHLGAQNKAACHPLVETLHRLQGIYPYVQVDVGQPVGADWLSPAVDLIAPDVVVRLAELARARVNKGSTAVIASTIFQSYQWLPLITAIGAYLLDRRVLNLRLVNVRMHLASQGVIDRMALTSSGFAALPGDPAVGQQDVHVVDSYSMLRDCLRQEIEAHLGAVIDLLCQHLGCRPDVLWLNAADRSAQILLAWMQEQTPAADRAAIQAEIEGLLQFPGSPLNAAAVSFFELACQGQTRIFLKRATCCYWYKHANGATCADCPRRTEADRRQQLLAGMAKALEEAAVPA
ncbi:MAG: IucA/IucC family C-terminal-domain containing protein [Anaerolineae bacterium]